MPFINISISHKMQSWAVDSEVKIQFLAEPGLQNVPLIGQHRTSPVFPLHDDQKLPDLGSGDWVIEFYVHKNPFRVLGALSPSQDFESGVTVWFGIGLASIIIIRPFVQKAPKALERFAADVLLWEHWTINGGLIGGVECPDEDLPIQCDDIRIPDLTSVGDEPKAVFEEFFLSIALAMRRARTYTPSELPVLEMIEKEIRGIIEEVSYILNPRGEVLISLKDYDLSSSVICEQLYQQRIDRTVQINSALSYVISQAFRGAPPILTSATLVQRHSLLGIGRAHLTLVNLVRQIEAALNSHSLPPSIFSKWKNASPLNGFENGSTFCESSKWHTLGLPDLLLVQTPREDLHKLTYFSGRLGFRETEYSVVAAIQALVGGDSSHWHISTMTHEVLHGHVRFILDSLFSKVRDDDPAEVDEFWTSTIDRFRVHMRVGLQGDMKLIDSVRNVILSYCCLVPRMGSLTRVSDITRKKNDADLIGQQLIPYNDKDLRNILEEERRNISEIIVHALDLYYFYLEDVNHYVKSIWKSWESVPIVLKNIRQYLLRTILTSTSLDSGDPVERCALRRRGFCAGDLVHELDTRQGNQAACAYRFYRR